MYCMHRFTACRDFSKKTTHKIFKVAWNPCYKICHMSPFSTMKWCHIVWFYTQVLSSLLKTPTPTVSLVYCQFFTVSVPKWLDVTCACVIQCTNNCIICLFHTLILFERIPIQHCFYIFYIFTQSLFIVLILEFIVTQQISLKCMPF